MFASIVAVLTLWLLLQDGLWTCLLGSIQHSTYLLVLSHWYICNILYNFYFVKMILFQYSLVIFVEAPMAEASWSYILLQAW